MLRVTDGEFERVDLDGDIIDTEDGGLVLGRRREGNVGGNTLTTNKNVGETRILHLGQARLLVVVERDVAHVGLHVGKGERDLVRVLICK